MHQWNIADEAGRLIFSRPGVRVDVSAALAGGAGVQNTVCDGAWIVTRIVKAPGAPAGA